MNVVAARELALALVLALAPTSSPRAAAHEPEREPASADAPGEERHYSIERLCGAQEGARADRRMAPRALLALPAEHDEPAWSDHFIACHPEDVVTHVRECLPSVECAAVDRQRVVFRATPDQHRRIAELLTWLERELLPTEMLAVRVEDGTRTNGGDERGGLNDGPREFRVELRDDALAEARQEGIEAVVGSRAVTGGVALDLFLRAAAPIETTSRADGKRLVAFAAWAGSCIARRDARERIGISVASGAGAVDVTFELRAELQDAAAPRRIGPFVGSDGAPRWLEIWRGVPFEPRDFVIDRPELALLEASARWNDRVVVPPWDDRRRGEGAESIEARRLANFAAVHGGRFDGESSWNGSRDRLFLFAPEATLDAVRADLEQWRAAPERWRIRGRLLDGDRVATSFDLPLLLDRPTSFWAGTLIARTASDAAVLDGVAIRFDLHAAANGELELAIAAAATLDPHQRTSQRLCAEIQATPTFSADGGHATLGDAPRLEVELLREPR